MFKFPATFGCCFILAALFAPSAQAVAFAVNPGDVGSESVFMESYVLDTAASTVDLTFTDLKTLESGPDSAVAFLLQLGGDPSVSYSGFFSDAEGQAIGGTQFSATVDGDPAAVVLIQPTVWHGMLFNANGDFEVGEYTVFWTEVAFDRPIVGVVPEPGTALLMGLGLVGMGVVGRSRRQESQGTA